MFFESAPFVLIFSVYIYYRSSILNVAVHFNSSLTNRVQVRRTIGIWSTRIHRRFSIFQIQFVFIHTRSWENIKPNKSIAFSYWCNKNYKKYFLTNEREKNWQENKSVSCSNQHNAKVHPEIENLENLGLCKGQDNNTAKFGKRNTRKNLIYQ